MKRMYQKKSLLRKPIIKIQYLDSKNYPNMVLTEHYQSGSYHSSHKVYILISILLHMTHYTLPMFPTLDFLKYMHVKIKQVNSNAFII